MLVTQAPTDLLDIYIKLSLSLHLIHHTLHDAVDDVVNLRHLPKFIYCEMLIFIILDDNCSNMIRLV